VQKPECAIIATLQHGSLARSVSMMQIVGAQVKPSVLPAESIVLPYFRQGTRSEKKRCCMVHQKQTYSSVEPALGLLPARQQGECGGRKARISVR